MEHNDVFSEFLHGLEDEIDEVDPVVDFDPESVAPHRVQARASTTNRTTEEPLAYLSGIMTATAETTNPADRLLDDGDLFLLN